MITLRNADADMNNPKQGTVNKGSQTTSTADAARQTKNSDSKDRAIGTPGASTNQNADRNQQQQRSTDKTRSAS